MTAELLTVGHLMMLAALFLGLYGLRQVVVWAKHRDHNRGTPGYARARDGRLHAIWSLAAGFVLFLAGWSTPLHHLALT